MEINIDQLSEAELYDLNRRIVERLRFFQQMRAHRRMLEFKIGDRVMFLTDSHGQVAGALTKYNKKTVTVITDQGQRWNVAPSLLVRIEAGRPDEPPNPTALLPGPYPQ